MSAVPRLLFVGICLLVLRAVPAQADLLSFDHGSVTISSSKGPQKFSVELATSEAQREQGLMYRPALDADAGMLFVYDTAQPVVFWMKNTIIPLDMLFIGADGHIISIRERAVPFSEETIPSDGPALAVLEINGGQSSRRGIHVGDTVQGLGIGGH